jgi:thymidylate kinase
MDETLARRLLEQISRDVGRLALLWRGPDLKGSDIDILLLPGGDDRLAAVLTAAGLEPGQAELDRMVWSRPDSDGRELEVDVLRSRSWPWYYPSLAGVVNRSTPSEVGLRAASPADRLLMLAAEALAGKSLEKIVRRSRPLLQTPRIRDQLTKVARSEGLAPLAALIEDIDGLIATARRGRLPYRRAAPIAIRSRQARAALVERLWATVRRRIIERYRASWRRPHATSTSPPYLIALSGMDGSGKSTAARSIAAHLNAVGLPAEVRWWRLAQETEVLNRIAKPVKRLLRVADTVADPVALGEPPPEHRGDTPSNGVPRRAVSWVWVLFVAFLSARSFRRAVALRGEGISVVCDRWLTDVLVDLELRYGRRSAAGWLLRLLIPVPDLAVFLEVDHVTASRRKPGDQTTYVLARMQATYSGTAQSGGLVTVDARAPREKVRGELCGLVNGLIEGRAGG